MPENSVIPDGEAARRIRREMGLSQEKLAQKAGYDVRTISNIENSRPVQVSTLASVAQALGVQPIDLMVDDSEDNDPPSGAGGRGVVFAVKSRTYDVQIRIDDDFELFDEVKRRALRDFLTSFLGLENAPDMEIVAGSVLVIVKSLTRGQSDMLVAAASDGRMSAFAVTSAVAMQATSIDTDASVDASQEPTAATTQLAADAQTIRVSRLSEGLFGVPIEELETAPHLALGIDEHETRVDAIAIAYLKTSKMIATIAPWNRDSKLIELALFKAKKAMLEKARRYPLQTARNPVEHDYVDSVSDESCVAAFEAQDDVESPPTPPLQSTAVLPQNQKTSMPDHPVRLSDEVPLDQLLENIGRTSHFEERYDIRGKIASGGMGDIFHAIDTVLDREVAVKVMRDVSLASSKAIRGQFLKEARIAGRLLHPNMVPVFDLGVSKKGQAYFTMRMVHGGSLRSFLEAPQQHVQLVGGTVSLRGLVKSIVAVCNAVSFAHRHGVLHLDLKPSNVLLSRLSEVFIIDWGLARVDGIDDSSQLSEFYDDPAPNESWSGTVIVDIHSAHGKDGRGGNHLFGTPQYMAPEQAGIMAGQQFSRMEIDARADVYGLGGILYSTLYKGSPNSGQTAQEMWLSAGLAKKPAALRTNLWRPNRSHNVEIKQLEDICLKARAPNPLDRYQTVDALIDELSRWRERISSSDL